MFSRLTTEILIGFVMCIVLVIQCSKKKPEKTAPNRGSKTLDQSLATNSMKNKRKSKPNEIKKEGEDVQKSKSAKKSSKSGDKGGKVKSKTRTGSKRTKDGEKDSSSRKNQSNAPSKPMDGTQNGPTPNDPTGNASENHEPDIINFDDIKDPLDVTIDDPDNPAVHERVTRLAATELIFDPKMVAYKGNVDNEKDPKEVEELEKELQEACDKHEARFKDLRRLEEKDPNYRRPKSTESEKSIDKRAPVPPDQRIKMRPDQCVLYETKEQITEDDEMDQQEDQQK